jgi:hypothetical protein
MIVILLINGKLFDLKKKKGLNKQQTSSQPDEHSSVKLHCRENIIYIFHLA